MRPISFVLMPGGTFTGLQLASLFNRSIFLKAGTVDHNLRFPLVNGDTHTDGSLPVFQQLLPLDVKQHTQCTTSFFNSHTSCIFSGTKLNRIVPNQTMQNIENQRKQI